MYNTIRDAFQNDGPCPASHPVRVPQVAYETLWDTTQFNNQWPQGAPNPFVMSYDDSRGYGTHADYVFGWEGDSLQRAMDHSCMFNACENGRPLKSQGVAAMNACQVQDMVGEDTDGCELILSCPLPHYIDVSLSRACKVARFRRRSSYQPHPVGHYNSGQSHCHQPGPCCHSDEVRSMVSSISLAMRHFQTYGSLFSGGTGWTGPKTCVAGSTCTALNQFYSQCS